MLKGISPIISPKLLRILAEMGHGDEILLADTHYPAHTMNDNVIRADGIKIPTLLDAILPLFELDSYVEYPVTMMAPVEGDQLNPEVEKIYMKAINRYYPEIKEINRIERFKFYERSKDSFAIVQTGELAKYGNIFLQKGVTSV